MDFKSYLILIILSIISIDFDVIHTVIDPTIAMCIDGEVDTAFLTRDGSTYIFMGSWFWKLKSDLSGVESNASEISVHWNNLPDNIETSFYVSGETNALNGKTFFIKNHIWYKFSDKTFEEWGDTSNWTDFPRRGDMLAISQYNDPIVVFYQKNYYWYRPKAYFFDSPYFPELKSIVANDIPFDTYETEAFVSYSDGKYLIFFDDNRIGGHCIMNGQSGCEVNRLNSDLFVCPDSTKNLFERNLFIRIWFWSGLGLKQFAILFLGFLVSFTFILIFLLLIVGLQVKKHWKRLKKQISE